MKKLQLKTKIERYAAVAGGLLATGAIAQAQVVVTSANDTLIDVNNGYYDIDLNQDGVANFRLKQYLGSGVSNNVNGVVVSPLGGNGHQVAGELKLTFNYPFRFEVGDSIGQTQTQWNGTGLPFENGYMVFEVDGATYPNSNWAGPVTAGYLGLRLRLTADDFLFGWARVSIAADNKSFTVHEFGYEQSQNQAIVAGGNRIGVPNLAATYFQVNNDGNTLRIKNLKQLAGANLQLTDMAGRVVHATTLGSTDFELDLKLFSKGIYALQIALDAHVVVEKIGVR